MTTNLAAQVIRSTLDLDTVRLSTKERRMVEQAVAFLVSAAEQKPQPPAQPTPSDG
jgi:hypothetical protein